jgi:type I restriction enzyme S subunit
VRSWRRTRLKYLASIKAGVWGDEPGVAAKDVFCVRAADFDRRKLRVSPERLPLRSLDPMVFRDLSLKSGDIVLEKSGGGADQPVGGSVLFDMDLDAVCSNFATRVRPQPRVEPRFLNYLMATIYYAGVTASLANQTTGIANLDVNSYMATWCDVPDQEMQRAIADYLDAEIAQIDALAATRRRSVDLARERFEARVWWATTKGLGPTRLRDSGVAWVGGTPAHWGTPAVGYVFEVQLGKMLNPEATASGEMFPYLRNENVQWDRIDVDDLKQMHFDAADRSRYALRAGDLMVCEGGEVGRAAMWRGDVSACYYQKALHRVRARRPANARFLMYVLRAAAGRGVFANEGNTSTIVHLTAEKLRAHRFPCPPPNEQDLIAAELDAEAAKLVAVKSTLDHQIRLLGERRQALIAAAVTGQLEVPAVGA